MTERTQCTANNRHGTQCKAWAVPGTQPPRCAAHGGASKPPGAPTGNKNAVTHGFYAQPAPNSNVQSPLSIDLIIEDLHNRQIALSHYLDKAAADEQFTDLLSPSSPSTPRPPRGWAVSYETGAPSRATPATAWPTPSPPH